MKQITLEQFDAWIADAGGTLGYGEWSVGYVNDRLNGDFDADFGPIPDLRILRDILGSIGLGYSWKQGRRSEAWHSVEMIRNFYHAAPMVQNTVKAGHRAKLIRELAVEKYGSTDIDIADNAEVEDSPSDGAWVSALLWVSEDDMKDGGSVL